MCVCVCVYTPRPFFAPVCFTPFCFDALYQFISLLNLFPLIFYLTPFGWWYVILTLYFCCRYHFLFMSSF